LNRFKKVAIRHLSKATKKLNILEKENVMTPMMIFHTTTDYYLAFKKGL